MPDTVTIRSHSQVSGNAGPSNALTTGHQDPDTPDVSAVTSSQLRPAQITLSQSAKFIMHSANKDR